ncbi:MAG TPA: YgjP-like metallopeptidase domain-containing protein [Patescibacteria group bacterium]|nr:YgjP-like metallopeptidase domain-containing protein [Patescibacteria group bacterium]
MQKRIHMPEIGEVILQKRKGARSMRLTVGHDGALRVSMPSWSPYYMGEAFARSKLDWIVAQQATRQQPLFTAGQRIGKAHRLQFVEETRQTISSRVGMTSIVVRMPLGTMHESDAAQAAVRKAAVRALKQEAAQLLPDRVHELAKRYGFNYRSVTIKRLKSRWGSCNSHQEIALNCYLMQLPWELIDYVILHELTHTRIMAHGPSFWDELSRYVVSLNDKRKAIKAHQPALLPQL